jgi:hypothetical protein
LIVSGSGSPDNLFSQLFSDLAIFSTPKKSAKANKSYDPQDPMSSQSLADILHQLFFTRIVVILIGGFIGPAMKIDQNMTALNIDWKGPNHDTSKRKKGKKVFRGQNEFYDRANRT